MSLIWFLKFQGERDRGCAWLLGLWVGELPKAAGAVDEQAGVAEDLELLTDFVFDVVVAGVYRLEFGYKAVGIVVSKF